MNDTPTPRTDAAEWIDTMCEPSHVVESKFARTLERELTAAREEISILKTMCIQNANEANDLRQHLDRLAEAHKLIAGCLLYDELNEDQIERADFETGYDEIIKISREALQSLNPKPE